MIGNAYSIALFMMILVFVGIVASGIQVDRGVKADDGEGERVYRGEHRRPVVKSLGRKALWLNVWELWVEAGRNGAFGTALLP